MQARTTRTSASVGSLQRGSGTFSTRTSPAPYITVARIRASLSEVEDGSGIPAGRVDIQETRTGHAVGGPVDRGTDRTPHCRAGPPSLGAVSNGNAVKNRSEMREFLTSRRARITPEQAGLPVYGGNRRVPGCAGRRSRCSPGSASTTTPAWSGGTSAASPRASWRRSPGRCSSTRPSARTCSTSPARRTRRRRAARRRRPQPAGAAGRPADPRRHDRGAGLRAQRPARTSSPPTGSAAPCTPPMFDDPVRPANIARFVFLDPRAREFFLDWDGAATTPSRCCAPRPAATPTTGR